MSWQGRLIDMEMDDETQLDHPMPLGGTRSQYPYGLRICLTQDELAKLDLEPDCEVGDTCAFDIMAVVTSVHRDELGCRVELQITKMCPEEDE